ncbi:MAG TPA: DUF2254 domain-containing protein [Thermoanaerobaculia bacterium]
MPATRVRIIWDRLSSTLWFVPATMTGGAITLAFVMVWLDRGTSDDYEPWFFLYSGGAEGARSVLSTIAGSMITVAGVVFSSTVVALSFASAHLGPRLLRNFMKDRGNQIVLGTFISTFVYCLLVLRTVSETGDGFVPHIGVTAGLFMALASLAVLIYFIHHVARSLQADVVISIVAEELDRSIEGLYPGGMGEDVPESRLAEMEEREQQLDREKSVQVALPDSGYLHALEVETVIDLAAGEQLVIRLLTRPGRYIHDGTPVAEIWPIEQATQEVTKKLSSAFLLGRTRTSQQDVEFAINQLVEVALRALSPSINDPFTAITCIDRLSTGLLHLMRRSFPTRYRMTSDGRLAVIASRSNFDGVTDAAFHQIRQSGAGMPAVTIYLLESLSVLLRHATTDEQRRALTRHMDLVRRAGLRETDEALDRADLADRATPGD